MSTPGKRRWTPEAIREQLARNRSSTRGEPEVSEARWAFRRAAAVLVSFDPLRLRPEATVSLGPEDTAARHLMDDCTIVAAADAAHPPRWKLKTELRRKTLSTMQGRQALLGALEANPEETQAPEQRMTTACLLGQLPPLQELSEGELASLLDTVFLLEGVNQRLPNREHIQALLTQKRLLSPFEYLVGKHFQGRQDELDALRVFVGLIPAESVVSQVKHIADSFWKGEPSVLVIHGPGGMGKSTLLSKFLLEHTQTTVRRRMPFAYLDFDNPRFSFDEPLELVLEIVRQLGVQFPEQKHECESVAGRLHAIDQSLGGGSNSWVDAHLQDTLGWLVNSRLVGDAPPFLVVFDTFEELQYRTVAWLSKTQSFLKSLRGSLPGLRVVISGRAPLPKLKVNGRSPRGLELDELDEPAAISVLRAHGIESLELAEALMGQVGRNPLSLKLAAAVAKRENQTRGPLQDLKTKRMLFFAAKETVVQGQLYERILGHIHDPEVRKLAHPGLVLRQVTPTLIREVLAGPCDLNVPTPRSAERLFDELRREVSLVNQAGANRVRHRPDVRAVMLELLIRDRPKQVEAIHRAAVAFYEHTSTGNPQENRSEELYHRLMLGTDMATLDSRWTQETGELLVSSLREMPPSSQAFLAARLGLSLPDEVRHLAQLSSWERLTARHVESLLAGDTSSQEHGLTLLRERKERTEGSPLYPLEINLLILMGRAEEARTLLEEEALPSARRAPDTRTLLDLLLLSGQFHRDQHAQEVARERLLEAASLARKRSNIDAWMRALVSLLQLGVLGETEHALLSHELARIFESPSTSLRNLSPSLISSVVAEVGADHPGVLLKTLEGDGLHKPYAIRYLKDLGELIEARLRQGAPLPTELSRLLRAAAEWNHSHSLGQVLETWSEKNLGELAVGLLLTWSEDMELRTLLAQMLSSPIMRQFFPVFAF